jgi:hypothetical protein
MRAFEGRIEPLRLLDLVCAVQDVAANDREVVAALQHLLEPLASRSWTYFDQSRVSARDVSAEESS